MGVKKETQASPKIETIEEQVERIKSEIGTKYQAFNPQDYDKIDDESERIVGDFSKKLDEHEIGHYFDNNDEKLRQRIINFFDSIKVGSPIEVKDKNDNWWYYRANIPISNKGLD